MKNSKRDKSKADGKAEKSKSTKKQKSTKKETKGEDQAPDFSIANQKSHVSKKSVKKSQN